MKWVKASEKIPGENKNLVWRFIDRSGVYRGFIDGEFQFNSSTRLNTILQKQFNDDIEWLDESELSKQEIRDKAIEHYGNDPHLYGGQRDGFIVGYLAATQTKPQTHDDGATDSELCDFASSISNQALQSKFNGLDY